MTDPTRRTLLAGLGAGAALLPSFAGVRAEAAQVGGYKALVCVFLFGGMDGHDVLIPYDQPSYDSFANLRSAIAPEATRGRSVLLPLAPRNGAQFGARQFALPPELGGIKQMFDTGRASVVANVGPLVRPTDRRQYQDRAVDLPPRLFSHNDQQSVWQANAPEGARFGWGGLFADAALASGANPGANAFTTVSTSGDSLFLTGERTAPFNLGSRGPTQIRELRDAERRRDRSDANEQAYQRLRRHFSAADYRGNNLIARDVAAIMGTSLESNEAFLEAVAQPPVLGTDFPASRLGGQLRVIAETIAIRARLGVGRQVFFAATGGYDTHSNQVQSMPALLAELDAAITAFQSSMEYLGADRDVTLFTGSDFGRTFAINGDGTDHGWGGHHFVVGGAVNGGNIFGDPPPPGFDHAWDAGRGRLIPGLSVDQYAASLGSWFGLSGPELEAALPNLRNFDAPPPIMV
ncbi:MAG: DUF1501 domain-containing protein [Oceanicaulis sp.]